MRIIAGEHKGRVLKAPKGDGTRPTTDRVRESLMSMLASARGGFDGAVVLDAFAGSGALALEALSRGAAAACLVERDGAAAKVVEANARLLGCGPDRARVRRADVLKAAVPRMGKPYDLVFLDPPYATDPADVLALVARLAAAGLLAGDALVSYEHDAAASAAVDDLAASAGLAVATRRAWGDTVIDLLRPDGARTEGAEPPATPPEEETR